MLLVGVDVEWDVLALDSSGTRGSGQVASCDSCGQYSRMLLYKYHCLLGERPAGVETLWQLGEIWSPVMLQ